MLANIEKNIKILEAPKSSLKDKLVAYDKAKKDITKIENLFGQLGDVNIDHDSNDVSYNNIDIKLNNINDNIKKITTDEPDFDIIISVKKDILECKKFLEQENKLKISISKEDGKIKDITKHIRDNILITQISDFDTEDSNEDNNEDEDDDKNEDDDDGDAYDNKILPTITAVAPMAPMIKKKIIKK